MTGNTVTEMASRIRSGDRRALARAVTLTESTRIEDRKQAQALLAELATGDTGTLRIGLSGTPGVGKSTFIEQFGLLLTGLGLKVAILAVDPSSARTGGSILGDKTRMPLLSRDRNAFIRPSPSQTALGGVALRTRNVIELCDGAGFDVVIVETVGVGQSETMVADMTDVFLLLLAPAGGDELQGVKRGIMERADLIVVNKADGDLAATATRTAADYSGALRLMRHPDTCPEGFPKAMLASALTNSGIDAVWEAISTLADWRRTNGVLTEQRRNQSRQQFRTAVTDDVMTRLHQDPALNRLWADTEAAVSDGQMTPDAGATVILDALFSGGNRT